MKKVLVFSLFFSLFFIYACKNTQGAEDCSLEVFSEHQSSLNYPSQITSLYQLLECKPIWNEKNIEKLKKLIENSVWEGLNPADYQVDFNEDNEEVWIKEVKLTNTLLKLAYHTYYGRVNPNKVFSMVNFPPKKDTVVTTLAKLLEEDRLEDLFTTLAPEFEEYHILKDYLRRYKEIIEVTKDDPIELDKKLKPGDQSHLIPKIRKRLYLLGYLETFTESQTYDQELKVAIQKFQKGQNLRPTGIIDQQTVKLLELLPKKRVTQISINLEKFRWLPQKKPEDLYVWVNIPSFELFIIKEGNVIFYSPVIVGKSNPKDFRPTPLLYSKMTHLVINPPWNIPPNVYLKDFFPKITKDPGYLLKQGVKVYANNTEINPFSINWENYNRLDLPFRLVQPPGNGNALGKVKFQFPNPFDVYLHDTPKKHLFRYAKRDFSSGCVRVKNAVELARFLVANGYTNGWDEKRLIKALQSDKTIYISINSPIPVYLVYFTTVVKKPYIYYLEDLYGYDQKIAKLLKLK